MDAGPQLPAGARCTELKHIIPVNDTAERVVNLIKKYLLGTKLTNDETQRHQYMLQVVEKRR